MDLRWTVYKSRADVPALCCLLLPLPSSPFMGLGVIGGFPACGDPSTYIVEFTQIVASIDPAVEEDVEPVLRGVSHYTGLCVQHTAELKETVPAKFITSISDF